jgi:hypothetical protein
MKKTKSFCVCFLSVLYLSISAEAVVVETNNIAQTLEHATKNSLYVFDLDNTVIETSQHLGSDQWVSHMLDRLVSQGKTIQEALADVIPKWIQIHERTEMKLVDPAVSEVLDKLKKKKISCIGLTKREPLSSNTTLEQLERLKIVFNATAPLENGHTFDHLKGTLYKNGVIFVASGMDKGPSLVAYLKKLKKMPSQIVLIDDKLSHIKNVESAVEALSIPFVGIRYGAADEKVKAFNPQIADLQMKHFNQILSDEEALHLLKVKEEAP